MTNPLQDRLERERSHGRVILATEEKNWGWHTAAGRIRWQRRLDYLSAAVPSGKGRVLEIGCGTGTFTTGLAAAYPDLSAIDVSADLLAVARRKAPNVKFSCMDAHQLEYPDETFDAIVGCSVLHHLDWALAVRGFLRKLKPGGMLRFSEPNLLNPQIFLQKNIPWLKKAMGDSPDEYAFTARRIRSDLRSAGYQSIHVQAYEFLHPSIPEVLIAPAMRMEAMLERTPARHIGGSLHIEARSPVTEGE